MDTEGEEDGWTNWEIRIDINTLHKYTCTADTSGKLVYNIAQEAQLSALE